MKCILRGAAYQHKQIKRKKIYTKNLFSLGFVEIVSASHEGAISKSLRANHLASIILATKPKQLTHINI